MKLWVLSSREKHGNVLKWEFWIIFSSIGMHIRSEARGVWEKNKIVEFAKDVVS